MMYIRQHISSFRLTTLCLVALTLLLTGCDFGIIGVTSSAATATANAPIGSPKGSGTGNLTTPATSGPCSTISATPAVTSGWKIYQDSRFSFKAAIPSGWRAGSFVDDSGNDYIVLFFPPGSSALIGQVGLADREHFAITIALSGPINTYANDPNWKAEAGSITISGAKVALYDRATQDCQVVNRGATTDFDGHHFTFFLTSVSDKAKADIELFLGMLQSFVYAN